MHVKICVNRLHHKYLLCGTRYLYSYIAIENLWRNSRRFKGDGDATESL